MNTTLFLEDFEQLPFPSGEQALKFHAPCHLAAPLEGKIILECAACGRIVWSIAVGYRDG